MKIASLTLNPCIDKTLYFNGAFKAGSLNRAAYSVQSAGGKGINVARIYRRLGIRASAYGFCGGAVGGLLRDLLSAEDLNADFVPTAAETRMCMKMIDADGVCTEANEAGGPITEEEYKALRKKLIGFAQTCGEVGEEGYFFAGGSVPAGIEKSAYRELIHALAPYPVRFILDADGEALKAGLDAHPWLIKPNDFELAGLLGYELTGRDAESRARSAAKASRRICAEYGTNVLCTLGADGAVYTDEEGSTYVNAPKVRLRGFTGAGDTFLASFVFAYEKTGGDTAGALCFASSAAAAKVELSGTEMPNREQMMKFVEKVEAKKLDV